MQKEGLTCETGSESRKIGDDGAANETETHRLAYACTCWGNGGTGGAYADHGTGPEAACCGYGFVHGAS